MDIKRKKNEKRIQLVGGLIGICVACSRTVLFLLCGKGRSREKNGGDCKIMSKCSAPPIPIIMNLRNPKVFFGRLKVPDK